MIDEIKETVLEIANLQKQLYLIKEDESMFNELWDLFENNLFKNISNTSQFYDFIYYKFVMILVKSALNRIPEKIDLYRVFISEYFTEIAKYFLPYELINLFQNEPSILDEFLSNKIITIEDIIHYLNTESIVENYGYEILSNSSIIIANAISMKSKTKIEYIIGQINLKQNQKNIIQNEEFDDDNEIVKFIKDDDIEHFQSCIALSNIDVNKILTFQKRYSLEYYRSLSLIELAAKSNSIKIFKFLFIQPKIIISSNLIIFAISGGSYDIIHMCESKLVYNHILSTNIIKEAIKIHQNEIFFYLIENYEIEIKLEFLYFCLKYCNLELFYELFKKIKIDFSNQNCLLLHEASFYGYYYLIEKLIKIKEFEILIDKEDSNCQTPIMIASNNGHIEIVKLLNETNKISTKSIQSAIVKAVINGFLKCVEYLLDFVDINAKIDGNTSLLHLAIYHDHLDIIELLLSRENVDVNICSSNGFYPIHQAIILGNEKVVSLLLNMPDIDKCLDSHSKLKESPLLTAQKINNQKIIEMIQNHIEKNKKQ